MTKHRGGLARVVFAAHAAYFLVTALWPLLHYASFERVSGPKRDDWLVKTVAALLLPVGLVFASRARRGGIGAEDRVLAVGSAGAIAAVDLWYVRRRRISRVYLLDALAEAILIAGHLASLTMHCRRENLDGSLARV